MSIKSKTFIFCRKERIHVGINSIADTQLEHKAYIWSSSQMSTYPCYANEINIYKIV